MEGFGFGILEELAEERCSEAWAGEHSGRTVVRVVGVEVLEWVVSFVYVDIFKVEMDIGDARLGRKRRRSWRGSRDVNYCSEHSNTFTVF